jgi:plasmid stabilization system protein ParE
MDYQVVLSSLALDDLGRIVASVTEYDPVAAERLGHRLLDHAETLRRLPCRGGDVARRPGGEEAGIAAVFALLPGR